MLFSGVWSLYEISYSVCSFSNALDYTYIKPVVFISVTSYVFRSKSIKKKSGPVPEEDDVQGLTS